MVCEGVPSVAGVGVFVFLGVWDFFVRVGGCFLYVVWSCFARPLVVGTVDSQREEGEVWRELAP